MKYYVVADIHSFYEPFMEVLEEKGFFKSEYNKLILLGDALDRGPDAKKVIDFLLSLHKEGRLIYVKGNHEELFVDCLQSISRGEIFDIACGMSHHYSNGTFETLLKIADMKSNVALEFPDVLVSKVMKSDYYQILLPSCVDYFEIGPYIFTHGYIPTFVKGNMPYDKCTYNPDWRNADIEEWRTARWLNGMAIACKHRIIEPNKPIVVGHFHTSYGHYRYGNKGSEFGKNADFSPFRAEGILAIDACTAHTGKVNCIVFE